MTTKKENYREYFRKVSPFIRFQTVLRENDINVLQPNFSKFMKGNDSAMTEENLKRIRKACGELGDKLNEKV